MKIRTVIADDQLLARESLRRLLEAEPDIEIVGSAASGAEAVKLINRVQPDLAFLDIQLQDMDGFDVVRRLATERSPAIIFVSSNEEYALKAFDINAIDYLLKPCTARRLKTSIHRARELLHRGFLAVPDPDHQQNQAPKRKR